ncbi:hypothetical protein MTX26_20955 [Bradyrhizobium sp. ISRA443]|uniref:hypothetical protein n=1 Tax=unclassified Bradyrhizobium TaxID=2631580 RepID=UPI0024792817|nr:MULTISPECIES: hypothetical protein [unclassified Bradyrhizobium]WGR96920.1 hypothetical protein MTX23_20955 [Bradyrhizobium sp. ISRA436]WGS03807.1 hypothetical protein MTX18_20955 [Bradyrhizobium sp. ISRA437]WGS10691.1 hypothetical protein MTX26_20955 [Bradyrhizobium sp. ISRA443]
MTKRKEGLAATFLTLASASLASMMFTSSAFAQCAECAIYPNRDPFTQGLATPAPAPTVGQSRGASSRSPYNARAEMRGYHGRYGGNASRRYR